MDLRLHKLTIEVTAHTAHLPSYCHTHTHSLSLTLSLAISLHICIRTKIHKVLTLNIVCLHMHRHTVQTLANTRCVVWILEWRHGWMAASISLWKPSKWWQCIYIFIISFQLLEFWLTANLLSLSLSLLHTHTHTHTIYSFRFRKAFASKSSTAVLKK